MAGDTTIEQRSSRGSLITLRATAARRTLVLVTVFLACHGLFGAMHQMQSPTEGQRAAAPQHLVHEDHVVHPSHADYYAVVVAALLLLGAAIWFLLNGVPYRAAGFDATRAWRHSSPRAIHLPRGPTAPLLQVFRL